MHKGWQRCAGAAAETRALEIFFSDLDSASRALLLSQCGPGASCAITVLPTGPDFTVPSDEFRILLLRRLRMPRPLAPQRCRCGGALDEYGDHRSACCVRSGGDAGAASWAAGASRGPHLPRGRGTRRCEHSVARLEPKKKNLDLPAGDARRIEVVANGMPIWRGVQVAVDTTPVSRSSATDERAQGAMCREWRSSKRLHVSDARTPSCAPTAAADVASSCSDWRWAAASERRCSASYGAWRGRAARRSPMDGSLAGGTESPRGHVAGAAGAPRNRRQ